MCVAHIGVCYGMSETHSCLGGGVSWGLHRGTQPIRGGKGGVGGTREGPQGRCAGSGSLSGGRDTRSVACGLLGKHSAPYSVSDTV